MCLDSGFGTQRDEQEACMYLKKAVDLAFGDEAGSLRQETSCAQLKTALEKAQRPFAEVISVKPWPGNDSALLPEYQTSRAFASAGKRARFEGARTLPSLFPTTAKGSFPPQSAPAPLSNPHPPATQSARPADSRAIRYHRLM